MKVTAVLPSGKRTAPALPVRSQNPKVLAKRAKVEARVAAGFVQMKAHGHLIDRVPNPCADCPRRGDFHDCTVWCWLWG